MNMATKAALFNALLFPGWGEIYLKKYKRGLLIIIAVMMGIISILWSFIQKSMVILKFTSFKKGTVTFSAVVQLAMDTVRSLNLRYLLFVFLTMILLWIVSIFDAYFLGKKEMAKYNATNESI
ncbi:MAG: hypothetical protein ABFD76_13940 [Smithella sp.]